MSYSQLFIFVEGPDDERFFNTIVKPRLDTGSCWVKVHMYREETPRWVNKFINSIKQMRASKAADYIFTGDIDQMPCTTAKKKRLRKEYKSVEVDRIIVIVKEIESWYLAGVNHNCCKRLRIPFKATTDNVCKEDFCSIKPRRFDSTLYFMIELLRNFDISTAKKRNTSFAHFAKAHL
jgi:hypothetical protein